MNLEEGKRLLTAAIESDDLTGRDYRAWLDWCEENGQAMLEEARRCNAYHQQLLVKEDERAHCSARVKQLHAERDELRAEVERLSAGACHANESGYGCAVEDCPDFEGEALL